MTRYVARRLAHGLLLLVAGERVGEGWRGGVRGPMTRYVARRLAHGLLLLVAVSLLTFLFAEAVPGDFAAEMRLDPNISEQTVEALRSRYSLDRPLWARYLGWLRSVTSGELGFSFAHNLPVGTLLWPRARNSLLLAASAMTLAWLIAVPLGVWSARRRGSWGDRLALGAASLPLAIPELVIGLGCLLLAARTGWFPVGGMVSLDFAELGLWGRIGDLAWHLTLPAVALAVGNLPVLVRHVRAALVEAFEAPFLRAARGHGIPRRRLTFAYALPAAANPLISLFGLSLARLLSGSLLIEVLLSWPGLGPLLLEVILARDLHLAVGALLLSSAFLVAGNLVADLLLYAADPRIRAPAIDGGAG